MDDMQSPQQPEQQPTQQPQQAAPQPQMAQSQGQQMANKKEGMSTGWKIFLGFCGGCLVLIVVVGIILAALGKSAADYLEQAADEYDSTTIYSDDDGSFTYEYDTDEDDDSFEGSLSTDDGDSLDISTSGDAEVPALFTSMDIPLYGGADAYVVYSATNDEGSETVNVTTEDSIDTVSGFYASELVSDGWTEIASVTDEDSFVYNFEKNGYSLSVVGAANYNDSEISISHALTLLPE